MWRELLVGLILIATVQPGSSAESRVRSAKAKATKASKASKGMKAPRPVHGASNEADQNDRIDGSKLFTGDTEVLPPGDWSASFSYYLAVAEKAYDDGGALTPLGNTRHNQFMVFSATVGLVENLDLTLQAGFNRISDLFANPQPTSFGALLQGSGAGLTNLGLTAHWRLFRDDETGRSLSVSFGPGEQSQLLLNETDSNYRLDGSFTSWDQSVCLRQDLGQFSTALEVTYSFPLQSTPATFQNLGVNAAVGWDVCDELLPVFELNYGDAMPYSGPSAQSLSASLGLVVKPDDEVSFTVGVQRVLAGRNLEAFTTYTLGSSLQF